MALSAEILRGTKPNPRLEQAAAGGPAIKAAPPTEEPGAVQRIQHALVKLGHPLPKSFPNGPDRPPDGAFGKETFAAVQKFQQRVFPTQPSEWDGRVGKNTLARMDALLPGGIPDPIDRPKVIADGRTRSRASQTVVIARIQALELAIAGADRLTGTARTLALQSLGRLFARDIAIVADKLRTKSDPLTKEFRAALSSVKSLLQRNLTTTSGIIDDGNIRRCDATNFNPQGTPFAVAAPSDPDPRVSVCNPFFERNDDMKRDVLTHEFFHLIGIPDRLAVNNTADALNDANTITQVVAYMHDRTRTKDSSGLSQPRVAYPSP